LCQLTSTCNSPILTRVVEDRVTVNAPVCPPPTHVTFHVVVAVTVYFPPGRPAEDTEYR
jgi:Ni,Fe-hydrogenase I small subunit